MKENKNHWYDGWIYDRLIAPNQDKLFEQIRNLIEPNSTIIDVGCGTGRFAIEFADKGKSILGIDLSKRNIDMAQKSLLKRPDSKISFKHSNVNEIIRGKQTHFDYAILTYVIHEVDENERVLLLKNVATIADNIILGDYCTPRPKGFLGCLSKTIEFIAGSDHYRNYKSYMANGGIYFLAEGAGLKVAKELTNQQSINHIAVLVK